MDDDHRRAILARRARFVAAALASASVAAPLPACDKSEACLSPPYDAGQRPDAGTSPADAAPGADTAGGSDSA